MAKRARAAAESTRSEPKPFPCPACTRPGQIPNSIVALLAPKLGARLVPVDANDRQVNLDKEGATVWRCSDRCGFAVADELPNGDERCPADGAPVAFDPTLTGKTCGGLSLRGWNVCAHCGGIWLSGKASPHIGGTGTDGRWALARGGRSLDVGGVRLRAEGKGTNVPTLMTRISRLPAIEVALEQIAWGTLTAEAAREIAKRALSIGNAVEEIDPTGTMNDDDHDAIEE